ncbi:Ribonuclease H-like superfamily [Arabidopsis thaliana x Arabidopsis arenosa]|uniref:Ribonuclease H-like superfamily n=1 Tax=Arabidopsis thaliana x Arabidopsis arenosa TaxID=1240361 RepID=A0A8T2C870_9BRAS|nr:Ribonuclease H-like superfamily [Arabidopsis thaliana x Arabidopsis arenosa]
MVQEIDGSVLPQNSGSLPQNTGMMDPPNGDGSRSTEEEQRAKESEDQRVQEPNPAAVAAPTVSVDDLKAIFAITTKDLADSIIETNRRLDDLARGIQQQSNSEVAPSRPIIPRTLAPSFDFTDAQSNRFTRMPQSSHQPDIRNEQQLHPQAPGNFVPGSSALDQGGHLEDIYAQLREIGSQVHQAVSLAPEIDRMIAETQKTPFTVGSLARKSLKLNLRSYILMHKDDCKKTAFITDRGTYCYRVMPFGLKNAGATYQRLVNQMFAEQLGVTMEVYIDDMLLNPTKCTFRVTSGEFLGYIVTERGIEANPKQINAILKLPSPQNKRELELSPDVIDEVPEENWILYADGSSSSQGSGLGILLQSPTGEVLEQSLRLQFKASNNETEYEALIAGLRLAKGIRAKRIKAFSDSQLVVSQFSDEFEAKNERMRAYLTLVQDLTKQFDNFELTKIPQSDNISADALAALASNTDPNLRCTIRVENIATPSIDLPPPICVITEPPEAMEIDDDPNIEVDPEPTDWRDPIKLYIADGEVPADRWEARRLKTKAANYILHDGELNSRRRRRQSFGGRALALKIKKDVRYWPTIMADCEAYAAKCESCQRHGPMKNVSPKLLSTVTAPYPFMRWAMDIVGPMPPSRSEKFLLVLTDYFTKWVEAEAYHEVKSPQVVAFIWKNIICRHGLPYEIVKDNGPQFVSLITRRFLSIWNIHLTNSTPRYPQGNGQAEATNKTIVAGIKKRLGPKKGNWTAELDCVLWSYRTTPRRPSGQSPFSLAYGVEAMAPSEAGCPAL